MSMEKEYSISNTHTRAITAVGCSPARRDIYLGFEDGVVKSIELDTGNLNQTYVEHKGMITAFLYWPTTKLLFCSSNDSVLTVIGSGGNLMDKIFIGLPVYSMILNNRKRELILGCTNCIQFHQLFETKEGFSHYVEAKPLSIIQEHTDIIRCLLALDSKIYSAGYDGALVIYDNVFSGKESAIKCFKNSRAHDAGIACIAIEKDSIENNIWIFTGSFDKTLKVWTGDGKFVHKFDGFISCVTGVSYLPKMKIVCFVAGTSSAFMYDPKSGEDVTEFIDTFAEEADSNQYIQLIKYLTEYNMLLATTSRRQLIVYKYNQCGCLTSLKYRQCLDSIAYTSKVPILIFTGDQNGNVFKWEQRQSNQLIYGSENLLKSEMVERESAKMLGQIKSNDLNKTQNQKENKTSEKSANKAEKSTEMPTKRVKKTSNMVLKLLYVESLDLLLAACEDGAIYAWGFDEDSVKILKNMKFDEEQDNNLKSLEKYYKRMMNDDFEHTDDFQADDATDRKNDENDSVTNRVAGFSLRKILCEHTSSVTSLVAIERNDLYANKFLLSAGWDRRICIWDLEKLRLYDLFRNKNSNAFEEVQLASDGHILDMCYCDTYNYFAYACSDSIVYIRKFAAYGSEMTLVNTLHGHLSDVNCIKWVSAKSCWITGGEDQTIRIWNDSCDCTQVINCHGSVNSICFDFSENAMIAACHDTIRTYDLDEYHLLQTNTGHHDSIRDIIYIPERNHIVSVSWDRTIKVWRSYRKQNQIRKQIEKESNVKFETWVWDQMKLALKQNVSNGANQDINELFEQLKSRKEKTFVN